MPARSTRSVLGPARGAVPWLIVASFMVGCAPVPAGTTAPGGSATAPGASGAASAKAPAPAAGPSGTAAAGAFRIVGYVGDVDGTVAQVQFDKLTHINYAFLIPRADGSVADLANQWKLDELTARAHAAGVKVLVSVGGWGWDAQFEAFAADPTARAAFVDLLRQFVLDHGIDGVDIDWEYPDPGQSATNYLALMSELRAALPRPALLTAAVVADGATAEGIVSGVFPLVDFINVMAYDAPGPAHSPYSYAEASLDYWNARGLPREKTVLGVPFYSRPVEVPYRKLVASSAEAPNADALDYFGTTVNYNGIATIKAKTELAMRRASGIMAWALAHDTTDSTSLLSAIDETVRAAGRR
jgi:chitinase